MRSSRRRAGRAIKRSLGIGIVPGMRPDKSVRARSLARSWGLTPAAAYAIAALRYPDRIAIVDERGALTFLEVHRRTDALAHAFQAAGIDDRDTVAVMCRNHRGCVEATLACAKLGADILYLDPALAPEALADVVARLDPHALIYDEEFSELLRPIGYGRRRFVAWCDPDRHARHPLLEELMARDRSAVLTPPRRGAQSTVRLRDQRPSRGDAIWHSLAVSLMTPGALSKIPLKPSEATLIAAPLLGLWGFLHFMLAARLASTLVLQREFDPNGTLSAASTHEVSALAVLPEMLEDIIELPGSMSASHDTSALRIIAVRGPELPSQLAIPAIERFGDVLHNLRGSTVIRLGGDWPSQLQADNTPARVIGDLWLGASATPGHAAQRAHTWSWLRRWCRPSSLAR